jgi:hypothetical protein
LTDEEKAIVNASLGLTKAFREQCESKKPVSKADARFLLEKAWGPLVQSVTDYDKSRATSTLSIENSLAMGSRASELRELSERLQQWIA